MLLVFSLLSTLHTEIETNPWDQFAPNRVPFLLNATHYIYSVHIKILTLPFLNTTKFSTLPHLSTCCPFCWTCNCLIVFMHSFVFVFFGTSSILIYIQSEVSQKGIHASSKTWSYVPSLEKSPDSILLRLFHPCAPSKLSIDVYIYLKFIYCLCKYIPTFLE